MLEIIPTILLCSAFRIGTISLAVHHIIAIDQWILIMSVLPPTDHGLLEMFLLQAELPHNV